jgi:hypothetical protein
VAFYKVHGVWSYALDDDNCYCHTTIEIGARLCQGNDSPQFGVDMVDNACGQPTTGKSMFMYFRKKDRYTIPQIGANWNMFFNFVPQQNRIRDMLGMEFGKDTGTCKFSKSDGGLKYTPANCPQQMPRNLNREKTQLAAMDGQGTIYVWEFKNSGCDTSNLMYKSLTEGYKGRVRHIGGCSFNPEVLAGSKSNYGQDSWNFVECHGTRSFILDDDGCYCQTTLEVGSRICSSGSCNHPVYGMDYLRDPGCGHVSNGGNRILNMFYRDCSKVKC